MLARQRVYVSAAQIVPTPHHEAAAVQRTQKNATPGKRIKAYRGSLDYRNVGRIVEYDGSQKIDVWPTDNCNKIMGTDGTIFPPFLKKEEGLVSFAPDLCRSLAAFYVKKTKYDGIPVREYSADLGDMSKNADEKCYCPTPETCLKKGVMDLYKCTGIPIYASLPHFYNSDKSYLRGVKGLTPEKKQTRNYNSLRRAPLSHPSTINAGFYMLCSLLGDSTDPNAAKPIGLGCPNSLTTGSPVYAKKRLQFSMPLEPNPKVDLFHNITETILPLFWVEEGVELNITYTKQLKDFFKIKKIVKISKWIILVSSLGGLVAAGYLYFKEGGNVDITPVRKVQPTNNDVKTISTVNGNNIEGNINRAMSLEDEKKRFKTLGEAMEEISSSNRESEIVIIPPEVDTQTDEEEFDDMDISNSPCDIPGEVEVQHSSDDESDC
ncbi:hypothetical protein NQ318_020772 [Aromia moschata]|uniref:Sensory neuron membrane protein 1 n=1 Tax=Aromia moschata TaxID=1265417 RepID=A0AAV8YAV1_9CUCU|nr:hypothetical protein NQ318_020772 [Aromia moschata]